MDVEDIVGFVVESVPSSPQGNESSPSPDNQESRQARKEREQARNEQSIKEKLKAVKSGEDEVGAALFNNYKETAERSSASLGSISDTRERAQRISQQLEQDPAAANKLHTQLDILYRQSGLGKYEVVVEGGGEQSSEQILKKMQEDLQGFPERFAEARIRRYCEQAVKVDEARAKAKEVVGQENIPRDEVRKAAYNLQKQEDRLLLSVVQPEMRSLYDPEDDGFRSRQIQSLNDSVDRVRERRAFKEVEQEEGEHTNDPVAITDMERKMTDRLVEVRGPDHADAFSRSQQENKKETLIDLHITKQREQLLRENIAAAVEAGDAKQMSLLTKEIREVQLDNKSLQRRTEVIAFEQLATDSISDLNKARDNLSGELTVKNAKEVISATRDVVVSHIRAGQENIKQGIAALYNTAVAESVESVKDRFQQFKNGVDGVFISHLGLIRKGASEKLNQIVDKAIGYSKQQDAEQEERRLDLTAEYYRQRHGIEQGLRRGLVSLAGRSEQYGEQLRLQAEILSKDIGTIIASSPDAKEARRQEKQKLREQQREVATKATTAIEDEQRRIDNQENPYMRRFQEALLNKVQNMSVELPEQATPNGGDGVDESELEDSSAVQAGGQAPFANERDGGGGVDGDAEDPSGGESKDVLQDLNNTDIRYTPDKKKVIFKWKVDNGGVYSPIYVKLDNGQLENVGTAQKKEEVRGLIQGYMDKMSQ